MYDVVAWNASPTTSGWRQKNIPAPIGTENHLCASQVIESAASIPARHCRRRGEMIAAPPQAASTWNHTFAERQNSASLDNGSIAPAPVVPAVPTIISR